MRILYLCGREPSYIRNLMLRSALQRSYDVVEITSSSRSLVRRNAAVALRYLLANRRAFDLIVVGFYGQPLMPGVRLWADAPIVFDAYVSTYDTLCFDRCWFRPRSLPGRLAYLLDLWSCRWATRLLLDTQAHADYFMQTFAVPADKVSTVYVGCDEGLFVPRPAAPRAALNSGRASPTPTFDVFTYTSFLRLHGVEHILDTAKRLAGQRDLVFTVGGSGPRLAEMRRLANDLGLENVRFPGWIPFERLPERIAMADVCLGGHFSTVPKAGRVIATKTFQFLAMAKPTVVGDNPANREVMTHGEDACLCPMADPEALAETIHGLYRDVDLRARLASNGRRLFEQRFSLAAQTAQLQGIVQATVAGRLAQPVLGHDQVGEQAHHADDQPGDDQ